MPIPIEIAAKTDRELLIQVVVGQNEVVEKVDTLCDEVKGQGEDIIRLQERLKANRRMIVGMWAAIGASFGGIGAAIAKIFGITV